MSCYSVLIGCSGVTEARVCRLTGSLSRWTAAGVSGLLGQIVHALVAAALRPVYATVIVPGSFAFTIFLSSPDETGMLTGTTDTRLRQGQGPGLASQQPVI